MKFPSLNLKAEFIKIQKKFFARKHLQIISENFFHFFPQQCPQNYFKLSEISVNFADELIVSNYMIKRKVKWNGRCFLLLFPRARWRIWDSGRKSLHNQLTTFSIRNFSFVALEWREGGRRSLCRKLDYAELPVIACIII